MGEHGDGPRESPWGPGVGTPENTFIPNFVTVALPLTDLLKTKGKGDHVRLPGVTLKWLLEYDAAFTYVISFFTSEPALIHPNKSQKFIVQVDVSNVAMGAVLLQWGEDSQLHLCAYLSKKLSEME